MVYWWFYLVVGMCIKCKQQNEIVKFNVKLHSFRMTDYSRSMEVCLDVETLILANFIT